MKNILLKKFSLVSNLFVLFTLIFSLSGCNFFSPKPVGNNSKTIEDLIIHFKNKGLNITAIYPMRKDIIGADSAVSLKVDKREIGIYKFDKFNTRQKKRLELVEKNKFLYIIGIKYPAFINGSFVMIQAESHPQKKKIIEIFNDF